MLNEEYILNRDCPSTLIPAGDAVTLEKGTAVQITQALGGTVTVRTPLGLFRIAAADLDALGEEVASTVATTELNNAHDPDAQFSEALVWDSLKTVFDPEIPINIVDLGLIYDLASGDTPSGMKEVSVKMTLTAQGCGMGPTIAADAKAKIETLPGVECATVDIVWDPVWNPQMISPEGRKTLGIE